MKQMVDISLFILFVLGDLWLSNYVEIAIPFIKLLI